MEIKLRQRLIGAVVLAAIIIIVVPSLFKSPHSNQSSITLTSTIPPEPAKPVVQTINKLSPDEAAPSPQASTIALGNNPLSNSSPNSSAAPLPQTQQTQALPLPPVVSQTKNQQGTAFNAAINNNQQAELGQSQSLVTSTPPSMPTKTAVAPATAKSSSKVIQGKSVINNKTVSNSQFVANEIANSMQVQDTTSAAMPNANAWVIQLGAFSNFDNAKDLEKTLRNNGFTAFTRNIKTSKGNLMRVMIGPETQRNKAEKVLTKLTNELKLNGVIVPFDSLQAK